MTTELRHRTTTTTETIIQDNGSPIPPQDFKGAFHQIGNGVRQTVQLTNVIILEFQGVVKNILPLFSADHQKKIRDIFNDYHDLLIKSQRFLTRALILAARARTSDELIGSIDINILEEMIKIIRQLIQRFHDLDPIIREKLKDHLALKRWRDIFCFMTGTGVAAFGVGVAIGLFSTGFTSGLKAYLITIGSITTATACATVAFHMAQHMSDLDMIIENLRQIRRELTDLTQNYTMMSTMIPLLSDSDETKQDFIKSLKDTQTLVNEGFELLKNL